MQKFGWNHQYNEAQIKRTLLDLLFFLFYLIAITTVSFGSIGPTTFHMANALTRLLVTKPFDLNRADATTQKVDESTFRELTTVSEFWTYLTGPFVESVYGTGADAERLYLLDENVLLGPPRVRQVRVRNGSCAVHELFKLQFVDCYGPFRGDDEDRRPFGAGEGTAWTHSSNGDGVFHWGQLAVYPAGGYYEDLTVQRASSEQRLQTLQKGDWIDAGSRMVMVEFTVYNANLNRFTVAKLVAELPACGGLLTSASFPTVKLLDFIDASDYVLLGFEIAFFVQTLWYTVLELNQLRRERCSYFASFWNWIDMTIVCIAYTTFAFSVYRHTYLLGAAGRKLRAAPAAQHQQLERLAFGQQLYNTALAGCTFLVWLKVFKYLSFNRTLLQLSTTLSRCAGDLCAFSLMFVIVFVAFAQLGYVLFSAEMADFRTYGDAVMTLLRTLVGDFDYVAIERADRVLGPLFFVSYIFFVFFVLLNMFLAILNDTYSEVKQSRDVAPVRVAAYLGRQFRQWFACVARCPRMAGRRMSRRRDTLTKETDASGRGETKGVTSTDENYIGPAAERSDAPAEQPAVVNRRRHGRNRVPVNLRHIFEELPHDEWPTINDLADIKRRLTVVEQTLDNVADKLNEFLVVYRERYYRQHKEDESPS